MKPSLLRHLSLVAACCAGTAFAQTLPVEMRGAKDHPLIGRYAGSTLQNSAVESFASVRVPSGPGRYVKDRLAFDNAATVEGKVTASFYVEPAGTTALEVFRNYQAAVAQSGLTVLYSCEMRDCDKALIREPFVGELLRPRKWAAGINPANSTSRDVRFLSARTTRNGTEVDVLVFVAEPDSIWQRATATVVVVEPAPVELGKVTVDAGKLRSGLAEEGRVALYGILFDTGKAEVKPESKAQLDEMARLLTSDPALKVAIVGHTDTQGSVDANLALSQHRAEAVVAVLVTGYRIDAARLRARGVASFAPVATNRNEAGRARNRRVELVEL